MVGMEKKLLLFQEVRHEDTSKGLLKCRFYSIQMQDIVRQKYNNRKKGMD